MTDKRPVHEDIVRAIAAYDREVGHPEIYDDLKND